MSRLFCFLSIASLLFSFPQDFQHKKIFTQHKIERRVAFDIGSVQTKMQVSEVDITIGKIARVIFTDTIPVNLGEDLAASLDGRISPEVQNKLFLALNELMLKAEVFKPIAYRAIATEALRIAKNGNELARIITEQFHLPVTIVSQTEEGALGFLSAINQFGIYDADNVVAWDFGGGSFQITSKEEEDYLVYQGNLGEIPFKNFLLEMQGKDLHESPNPICIHEMDQALQFIKSYTQNVPEELQEKLNSTNSVVLAIGLHPLWGMENNEHYDQERILQEIVSRIGLDDDGLVAKEPTETSHEDVPYKVSNLIWAFGMMKALNIEEVHFVGTEGSNAVGLLLSEKYWKRA